MLKLSLAVGASTLFIGALGTGLLAQTPPVADAPPAVRDPQTLAALDKMGAALRRLQRFEVRSDTTEERVLATGQKIQYSGITDAIVERPNRLRIERVNDRKARSLYFDGKTLTIYSPRMGFYGTVPASGTILQAVKAVAENYDLETPLVDLFSWGEDPTLPPKIKSAFYVGAETIGGFSCDQYAMRQDLVDWQVWIRQKGEALPCKLVITSTDDPSMPQYSAVYTWIPNKTYPASAFTFVPPKGATKIPLEKKAAAQPAGAE